MIPTQVTIVATVRTLGTASFVSALKAARMLNPTLSIDTFRACIKDQSPIATLATNTVVLDDYIDRLKAIYIGLQGLFNAGVDVELLDEATSLPLDVSDISRSLEFHCGYCAKSLSDNVSSYLKGIEAADWFANTGASINSDGTRVVDAIPAEDMTMTYIIVGMQNRMAAELCDGFGLHHGCMQALNGALGTRLMELSQSKLRGVPQGLTFSETSDPLGLILLACLEIHFSDQIRFDFGQRCTDWLTRGKVPVGWEGVYPDGSLLLT